MTLLRVEDLTVAHHGQRVLGPLSMTLPAGGRLAVIGQSGSGKTTLAMAVAGLTPAGARLQGHVHWPGLPRRARAGADIGVVFQDASASLDPVMRVGQQVGEVIEAHTPHRGQIVRDRAIELLGQVGLPEPGIAYTLWPHQLSGGQRQRVALACALAANPALLIADEMTSALDTLTQARIVALVDRLVRERGMALLFITHDIALASRLSDDILVMHQGAAVELLAAGQPLSAARHPASRALLAAHRDLATPSLIRDRA
jgi:peptide/nickel transport system ATP-binding protein